MICPKCNGNITTTYIVKNTHEDEVSITYYGECQECLSDFFWKKKDDTPIEIPKNSEE